VTTASEARTTRGCKRCQENPRSPCVACTQRRRRAMDLKENAGLTVEQIADAMRLTVPRVDRLLEEETQYRDLQQYVCDSVPTAILRALIRECQLQDPALTKTAIAERAGYSSRQALLRALGIEATARTVRGARSTPQLSERPSTSPPRARSCAQSAARRTKSPACSRPPHGRRV
jgi:hypothetical protein